jgi:hypothetical protein
MTYRLGNLGSQVRGTHTRRTYRRLTAYAAGAHATIPSHRAKRLKHWFVRHHLKNTMT